MVKAKDCKAKDVLDGGAYEDEWSDVSKKSYKINHDTFDKFFEFRFYSDVTVLYPI